MAYFPEALMNRVDEIFWVLRSGSMAIYPEILLMETLKTKVLSLFVSSML